MENGYPAQCTSFFLEHALKFIPLYNYDCNSIVIRLGMYLDLYLSLYLELKKNRPAERRICSKINHNIFGTYIVFCWRINTLFLFHGFARQELCERDRKWQFSCWLVYFSNTTSQLCHFYPNTLNNVFFSIWRFIFHIHNLTTLTVLPKLF